MCIIQLLPSSSAKAFDNTLLISETTFLFTAKMFNAWCWPMFRDFKFFLTLLTSGVKLCITRRKFLVIVMNQPAARPSITSYTGSQAKHFFSTCWNYQDLPVQFKTLNLFHYAAKYRYWKGLDLVCTQETRMNETQEIKCLPAWNECSSVNFGVLTKFKFRCCHVFPALTQPVNQAASTTAIKLRLKIYKEKFNWFAKIKQQKNRNKKLPGNQVCLSRINHKVRCYKHKMTEGWTL